MWPWLERPRKTWAHLFHGGGVIVGQHLIKVDCMNHLPVELRPLLPEVEIPRPLVLKLRRQGVPCWKESEVITGKG